MPLFNEDEAIDGVGTFMACVESVPCERWVKSSNCRSIMFVSKPWLGPAGCKVSALVEQITLFLVLFYSYVTWDKRSTKCDNSVKSEDTCFIGFIWVVSKNFGIGEGYLCVLWSFNVFMRDQIIARAISRVWLYIFIIKGSRYTNPTNMILNRC